MKWPQTVRGWVELVLAVGALLGALGGGAWQLHSSNAYATDVQEVERMVAEGLKNVIEQQKSDTCTNWLSEIALLEDREASGTLTEGQRSRLTWLRRQYEAKCTGDS